MDPLDGDGREGHEMPIHTDALGLNECFTPHLITACDTVHHVTEHWIPISSLVGIIFSVSLESPHCGVWLGASKGFPMDVS